MDNEPDLRHVSVIDLDTGSPRAVVISGDDESVDRQEHTDMTEVFERDIF